MNRIFNAIHALLFSLIASISLASQAAPLPWKGQYSHFSDQEPLSEVLKALASEHSTPIVISPKIKEVVSLHYKEIEPTVLLKELAKNYGLIWYYDKQSLYIYKKDEVQNGSVSMRKMSPADFTAALQRLEVLDDQFQWQASEVDNIVYFTGPERFVSAVLDMAKVMDTQQLDRQQIYRWVDKKGVVNFSSDKPLSTKNPNVDIQVKDQFPGFTVVDVVKDNDKK